MVPVEGHCRLAGRRLAHSRLFLPTAMMLPLTVDNRYPTPWPVQALKRQGTAPGKPKSGAAPGGAQKL